MCNWHKNVIYLVSVVYWRCTECVPHKQEHDCFVPVMISCTSTSLSCTQLVLEQVTHVLVQVSHVLVQDNHILVHECHVTVQALYKNLLYLYKIFCTNTRQSCTGTRKSCTGTWLSCTGTWLSCISTWRLVLVHDTPPENTISTIKKHAWYKSGTSKYTKSTRNLDISTRYFGILYFACFF